MTLPEMTAMVEEEATRWAEVGRVANIRIDWACAKTAGADLVSPVTPRTGLRPT